MSISSSANADRARSARITARASSHSPQPGLEYSTTSIGVWNRSAADACTAGDTNRAMRDSDVDDTELHRRLSEGEQHAFEELYRRYAAAAYGLAYRLTGQQVLAQDV